MYSSACVGSTSYFVVYAEVASQGENRQGAGTREGADQRCFTVQQTMVFSAEANPQKRQSRFEHFGGSGLEFPLKRKFRFSPLPCHFSLMRPRFSVYATFECMCDRALTGANSPFQARTHFHSRTHLFRRALTFTLVLTFSGAQARTHLFRRELTFSRAHSHSLFFFCSTGSGSFFSVSMS